MSLYLDLAGTMKQSFGIKDTDASHFMNIVPGSNLTANRILTITTGDAARTITLSGNPTLADWFDQAVKQASSPTFAGLTIGSLQGLLKGNSGAVAAAGLAGPLSFDGNTLTCTAFVNPMDAAGQLIYGGASGVATKLAAGATTTILVGGGAAAPVWTTATGTGAPVRAVSPTLTTSLLVTYAGAANNATVSLQTWTAGADATLGALMFYCNLHPSATGASRYVEFLAGDAADYRPIVFTGSRVGIGITNPAIAKLEVYGGLGSVAGQFTGQVNIIGTNSNSHFNYTTTENTYIRAGKTGATLYLQDAHNGDVSIAGGMGFVGIRVVSVANYAVRIVSGTSYGLQVIDSSLNYTNMSVQDNGVGYLRSGPWGYSDKKDKENVVPLVSDSLGKVKLLKPIKFDFKGKGPKNNIGFLAEDVQSIIPEAVAINPLGEPGELMICHNHILPHVVQSIQEIADRLEKLEKNKIK